MSNVGASGHEWTFVLRSIQLPFFLPRLGNLSMMHLQYCACHLQEGGQPGIMPFYAVPTAPGRSRFLFSMLYPKSAMPRFLRAMLALMPRWHKHPGLLCARAGWRLRPAACSGTRCRSRIFVACALRTLRQSLSSVVAKACALNAASALLYAQAASGPSCAQLDKKR